METSQTRLAPQSALEVLTHAPIPGITIQARETLGLFTLIARKRQGGALEQRLHEQFAIDLPHGPYRSAEGRLALHGIGPDTWLATLEQGWRDFGLSMTQVFDDLVSLTDQTDAYAVLRLAGARVREILSKMVSIDLHSEEFKVGDVAVTRAGHINATLWRLADGPGAIPVFEIAVPRSMAHDFWHFLADSAGFAATSTSEPYSTIAGANATNRSNRPKSLLDIRRFGGESSGK